MEMTGKEHVVCALVVVVVFLTIPVIAEPKIKVCDSIIPHGESGHIDCSSSNGVSFFQGSKLIANCYSENNGTCIMEQDVNGYIVTSAASVGKYFLTIPVMNGSFCGTYRCNDSITEDSVDISYTDTNTVTMSNTKGPMQRNDGITVEFSTSCLLSLHYSTSVLIRVWQQRGPKAVEVFHNMQGVSVTIENSTCTETCNEEYTSKIVTSFVHNSARTDNKLQGKYVVQLTIPDRNITLKASTKRTDYIFPGEDNEERTILPLWAIITISAMGGVLIIALAILICCCCYRRRKKNATNRRSSFHTREPSIPTVSNNI